MIIGIGTDKMDIRRIEKAYAKYGARFLERVFTPLEQQKALARHTLAPTLAKRFAAKEACAKALGTGIALGVAWRDIGVVNLPTGQPTLELTGGAAKRLAALCPAGHTPFVHVSLTDDLPYAEALVIIEARPIVGA